MTGAVSPACAATSVKWARKGMPEGLPRGRGFTLRGVTPWPSASVDAAHPQEVATRRRVLFILDDVPPGPQEQRPSRKPSGSATLPFCCAVLLSWRTPQPPFAFAPRGNRVGPDDSGHRAALDRAYRPFKSGDRFLIRFDRHRCGRDRSSRGEGLSVIAWPW